MKDCVEAIGNSNCEGMSVEDAKDTLMLVKLVYTHVIVFKLQAELHIFEI